MSRCLDCSDEISDDVVLCRNCSIQYTIKGKTGSGFRRITWWQAIKNMLYVLIPIGTLYGVIGHAVSDDLFDIVFSAIGGAFSAAVATPTIFIFLVLLSNVVLIIFRFVVRVIWFELCCIFLLNGFPLLPLYWLGFSPLPKWVQWPGLEQLANQRTISRRWASEI